VTTDKNLDAEDRDMRRFEGQRGVIYADCSGFTQQHLCIPCSVEVIGHILPRWHREERYSMLLNGVVKQSFRMLLHFTDRKKRHI